jgi:hypothetical protein
MALQMPITPLDLYPLTEDERVTLLRLRTALSDSADLLTSVVLRLSGLSQIATGYLLRNQATSWEIGEWTQQAHTLLASVRVIEDHLDIFTQQQELEPNPMLLQLDSPQSMD